MFAALTIVSNFTLVSEVTVAADGDPGVEENLDLDFIEFLGQISEVEELGVDVDKLLDMKEQEPPTDKQESE